MQYTSWAVQLCPFEQKHRRRRVFNGARMSARDHASLCGAEPDLHSSTGDVIEKHTQIEGSGECGDEDAAFHLQARLCVGLPVHSCALGRKTGLIICSGDHECTL